jgi:hypothetical protein
MNATTESASLELVMQDRPAQAISITPSGAVQSPAYLLQVAVERGAPMEYVEKLMGLMERWEANEARKAYNQSFAAFKAEAVTVIKRRDVTAGPLAGKKYAELHSVVNAATPALSRHGLSASWRLTKDEKDWLEVTCTLKHIGGHSESVSMGGPPDSGGAKNKIQERASTVTYLERYTLKAILGLSEQDDDTDGNSGGKGDGTQDPALQAGHDAAMQGMESLTAWWSSLTAKQRGQWSKEFGQMRKAAAIADGAGA